MEAPWWWSKTETCWCDIYVYFNVNFNVFLNKKCICWWVNSTYIKIHGVTIKFDFGLFNEHHLLTLRSAIDTGSRKKLHYRNCFTEINCWYLQIKLQYPVINRVRFPVFDGSTGRRNMAFSSTVITHKILEFIPSSLTGVVLIMSTGFRSHGLINSYVRILLGGRPLSS